MSNDHQQYQKVTTTSSDTTTTTNNSITTTTTTTKEYRPCSPDLSAYGIPSHSQQQQQSLFHPNYQDQHSSSSNHGQSASFQQRHGSSAAVTCLPGAAGSSSGTGYPPAPATHRGSYDASPYFCPQGGFSQGGYFAGPGQGQQQQGLQRREAPGYGGVCSRTASDSGEHSSRVPGGGGGGGLTYSPSAISSGEGFARGERFPQNQQESRNQHQVPSQPQYQSHSQLGLAPDSVSAVQAPTFRLLSSSISQQPHHQQQQQQQQQHNMPPSRRKRGQTDDNDNNGDFDYTPESSTAGGGAPGVKTTRKWKSDSGHQAWTVGRAPGEAGPMLGIDIKTKFPVARIKRIMQADEDVGKVAQATPTAVCELQRSSVLFLVDHQLTSLFHSQGTGTLHDHDGD